MIAEILQIEPTDILSVDEHCPAGHIVKPAQQIHQRGFSRSCRTENPHGLPGLYMEADIFENLLAVCLIGDVAELHFPAIRFFFSAFPVIPDPRFHRKGTVDFFHGSDKALDIVDVPSCHAQRHIQHPQIAVDCHHISHGDRTLQSQNAAVQHQNNRQDIGEQFEHRDIFCPDSGAGQLGVPVGVILSFKFLHLKVFLGKGLHDPVAADILLYKGIQGGKLPADSVKRRFDRPHLKKRRQSCKRQNTQHAHRQPSVHGKNHDQREDEIQHAFVDRINR